MAFSYILPGFIYDNLRGEYWNESRYYNGKYYKTEKAAITALENALMGLYYDVKTQIKHLNNKQKLELMENIKNEL